MTYYDEQLQQLQAQIARAKQLRSMIQELCSQQDALSAQVRRLESIKLEEQADVDRLEGRSLASFFYNVIGKMDEQLDKERREAYAAAVKYDAAVKELESVRRNLNQCRSELSSLGKCESRYEALLKEKTAAVKAAGGTDSEEILKREERIAFLESQRKELQEAIFAGNAALRTARQVLSSLDSAQGWGTWDLLGGGLITDLVKHNHLDEAQNAIERLQSQLLRFKTELADVTVHADMQVNIEGFLRFADYFFDGLFADWAVLDKISQSKEQVYSTKHQIESLLSRLNSMMQSIDREQAQLRQEIDGLVCRASLY